jgi:hypothetical protein
VTVVFEIEDDKARLALVHEDVPTTQPRDDAAGGRPGFSNGWTARQRLAPETGTYFLSQPFAS